MQLVRRRGQGQRHPQDWRCRCHRATIASPARPQASPAGTACAPLACSREIVMSACQSTRPTRRCQPHFSLAPRRFVDARGLIAPAWRQDEPVASFQACTPYPPWPWSRPRAVVACGAVSKGRGTLRQPVGCNAHEDGMLCACTPAMDKVPQHAFAPHIARGSTARQHSQPVL